MQNFKHRFHLNSHIAPFRKGHSWSFEEGKWKFVEYVTAWNLICIYLNIAIRCWKNQLKHFCETQFTMKPNEIVVWNLWRIEMHFLPSFIFYMGRNKMGKNRALYHSLVFLLSCVFYRRNQRSAGLMIQMEWDGIGFTAIKLLNECCMFRAAFAHSELHLLICFLKLSWATTTTKHQQHIRISLENFI